MTKSQRRRERELRTALSQLEREERWHDRLGMSGSIFARTLAARLQLQAFLARHGRHEPLSLDGR